MIEFKMKSAHNAQMQITDVASYLKATKDFSKNNIILYRGQHDKTWDLIPSIGRKDEQTQRCVLIDKEESIFLDFKMHYYLYVEDRPSTDIDTLFLAQHYGLPTRLLDWTDNPLIALWFACQESQHDGCVYTIKVNKDDVVKEYDRLNFDIFAKMESAPIDKEHLLIIPDYTNRRYLNQKGMFLWFKYPDFPITQKQLEPSFIIQDKKGILEELDRMGVNEAFVYPDLEHLCKSIKNKYKK